MHQESGSDWSSVVTFNIKVLICILLNRVQGICIYACMEGKSDLRCKQANERILLSLGASASYLAEMTLWTAFLWLMLQSLGEGHISSMSAAVGRPHCGEGVKFVNICISCQRLYIF